MNRKWWESPVVFIVDYWYLVLLLLILTLSFMTRSYWWNSPIAVTPVPTGISITQTSTFVSATEIPSTPSLAASTAIPVQTESETPVTLQPIEEKPEIGYMAPTLMLRTSSGQKIVSNDFKGHPVFLFIFSSWCPYCKEESLVIEKMHKKYDDSGLVILPINDTSNDVEADVQQFVIDADWSFEPLFDENGGSLMAYSLAGIPGNIFIDKDGIIRDIVIGSMTEASLEAALKTILQ